jgi:hypothetical protein
MGVRKKKRGKRSATTTKQVRSSLARIEREIPRRVGEYVDEMQSLLDRLERKIQKAGTRVTKEATYLLRQASRQLGKIEGQAEARGREIASHYGEEASQLLDRLRKAIAPAPRRGSRRKV